MHIVNIFSGGGGVFAPPPDATPSVLTHSPLLSALLYHACAKHWRARECGDGGGSGSKHALTHSQSHILLSSLIRRSKNVVQ